MCVNEIKHHRNGNERNGKDMGRNGFNDSIGTVNGLDDDFLKHFLLPYHHPPTFVHNSIYGYEVIL
jgi:hypothetical protein